MNLAAPIVPLVVGSYFIFMGTQAIRHREITTISRYGVRTFKGDGAVRKGVGRVLTGIVFTILAVLLAFVPPDRTHFHRFWNALASVTR